MCCLCNYVFKWLDIQVFSDKDFKLYSHLLHLIAPWLAGDDKVPAHLSKREGHVVLSVVVWPCLMDWCFTPLHRVD